MTMRKASLPPPTPLPFFTNSRRRLTLREWRLALASTADFRNLFNCIAAKVGDRKVRSVARSWRIHSRRCFFHFTFLSLLLWVPLRREGDSFRFSLYLVLSYFLSGLTTVNRDTRKYVPLIFWVHLATSDLLLVVYKNCRFGTSLIVFTQDDACNNEYYINYSHCSRLH